jgi:formate hydrogenlyase subunit 3/multisubunit Na+/H+ antiporter MnhD subunit
VAVELLGRSAPWAVLTIVPPLVLAALALPLGRRAVPWLPLAGAAGLVAAALALALQVRVHGPLRLDLGGWPAPLGIALQADGFGALMVLTTAVVGAAVIVHALVEFGHPAGGESRASLAFWPLVLFLLAALNAVFLGADLFNLYVALEVMGLAAVALVTVEGGAAALVAGMRYLLVALAGSLAYLLGVALIYAQYGVLDLESLAERIAAGAVPESTMAALVLMTVGLLAKTALFPLHVWLPPAHANAPAPASALLSALVVKASFCLVVRLWFDVFAPAATAAAAQLLGLLGAAAILWGSVLALRQDRLKLMVAYSSVAQIGYLFLLFPLAGGTESMPWAAAAWSGGIFHAVSHAAAKASMFLAAGTIIHALGHDRIAGISGAGQRLPITMLAIGLAGLTLIGLPPSGGFVAKWLLLNAALADGQWWWALVMLAGGLLAAGYVFGALTPSLAAAPDGFTVRPVPLRMELVPLALALLSALLGIVAYEPLALLEIGRPAVAVEGLP